MTKIIGLSLILMLCKYAYSQQYVALYKDSIPNIVGKLNIDQMPVLEIFKPLNENSTGSSIIIFPGGAYSFLAYDQEGSLVAKAFADRGIMAIVVKYRLPSKETMRDKSFGPLMDAQQAIKVVRENSVNWNINPAKIGVIGFSAGGHLASALGTHFNNAFIENKDSVDLRPNFMILVYPVISMKDKLTHSPSKIKLLGMEPTEELVNYFSNELQVTRETPPTYLTHCEDDKIVDVNNSIVFYQALQRVGVDAELHLYPKGGHGFTQQQPVAEWLDPILKFIQKEGFYTK